MNAGRQTLRIVHIGVRSTSFRLPLAPFRDLITACCAVAHWDKGNKDHGSYTAMFAADANLGRMGQCTL